MRLVSLFMVVAVVGVHLRSSHCVDQSKFQKCEESSFCRRNRNGKGATTFALVNGTLNVLSDAITIDLEDKSTKHLYAFQLEALEGNTFRMLIDEKIPLHPRYRVEWSLKANPKKIGIKVLKEEDSQLTLASGDNKVIIMADPFRVDFYQNGTLSVAVNSRDLMRFERLRTKPENPDDPQSNKDADNLVAAKEENEVLKKVTEDEDSGAWEEDYKSHRDSKPHGPEAVAMDFTFPQGQVLFGIPEHADDFVLRSTTGSQPYRLYNLDVFEYEVQSRMALYGSVPVLYAHGPQRTAGIFWHNAAETWVDIHMAEKSIVSSIMNKFGSGAQKIESSGAHFISESGIVDVFIMLGPTPMDVFRQYAALSGTAPLPQLYTLAYHQCRWNYKDTADVKKVTAKFDEYDIPMDTMWLDIEYTNGKRYFTWDSVKFNDPLEMIASLNRTGRHLVIIIDPHIKRDNYFFHDYCTAHNYYVKTRDNIDYDGWCWPGSSSYPDFFNPEVRAYYGRQYLLENFNTTTEDVMIWNDMNEPSVFSGPEVTMPKDLVHFGNWEHRDVHNIYGHMFIMSTFEALLNRSSRQRPFILTRSYFAGSQRYAAVWTGDNMANWEHLHHSIKMCLSASVAGISFCGADVGGFFHNPKAELLERWYQAGAFMPFFRSHSHLDTERREPWLYEESTCLVIREAIRLRYSYLPLWYTMFYEHERTGDPVMLPMLAHYPMDKAAYLRDSQFLLQDRLLVSPVLNESAFGVDVYFPSDGDGKRAAHIWYDVATYEAYNKSGVTWIPVNRTKIPVYQRGGSIIPKKERVRRASTLMMNDPYTLVVCLDRDGKAKGTLYIDDEKSYEYRRAAAFIYVEFEFANNTLRNRFIGRPNYKTASWLERVIVAGLERRRPQSATITTSTGGDKRLDVKQHYEALVVRKPGVNMGDTFHMRFNY